ncbi:ABC transporter ATP-binding protein [Sulfuricurvum sp.]|uniref:ABC transporter ATP-binding protein n=1 Tax=Sulfuricurvum sp. TaxID=2025608 RepID=UPI00286E069D|nr:ABC transporter ATP-binding protein [Sulfuricurvum sp.]
MLKIDHLSKHFKSKEVLSSVSLHVNRGEIISILGRSGSGKSTLLNLIAGFERADEGTISLEDTLISGAGAFIEPSKRSIGFVFQNYALFPHLSVADNIAFGITHLPKNERKERVEKLLSLISLEGYGSKYPDTLSGGEQQRVALARVLATEPSVILLDEPFSNVDTVLKTTIRDQLLAILRASGATALFVTHDPHEAMAISDRIAYIDSGKIVQFDTPEVLYHSAVNENVAAFFGPINRYKGGFVRVEQCRLVEQGGIHGEVYTSKFMGNRYETTVHFTYEQESCRFLIYTERRYENGEKVNIEF